MKHQPRLRITAYVALALIVELAACSGGSTVPTVGAAAQLKTPTSVSPGAIAPAPMAKTPIQPASAMTARTPANTITGVSWSQVPGSASQVAAATDGSVWVLSDQPTGTDKYIWHYSGGTWTNISGLASSIAIAPNGTLYAINSGGGTYAYSGGSWTALGGGAAGIAAVADNSIYVLSNAGGPDHAIWHNVGGTWSQVGGSGVSLVASFDATTHGAIVPGGFYIINSASQIYYRNADASYVQIPGSAKAVAPANGGLFALGTDTVGTIYYYDIDGGSWSVPGGSGSAIADASSTLYVLSAGGSIYTASAPTSNWACDNAKFNSDQANYPSGVQYVEEDVCGLVQSVLAAKHTSSGNHGYFYVTMPGGYNIEIVSNLDAMANGSNPPPPLASWPWVKVGDYVYVQGRYYYDAPHPGGAQGIDWTEGNTGSWPTKGWVVVNGKFYN